MKFAIIGAGAMGCRFGYQLQKIGQEVVLVDTPNVHVDAIRQEGLHVDFNGKTETVKFNMLYIDEIQDTVDVVIFLTKAMQLDYMVASVQKLFHDKTLGISLLNGLGHEEIIKKYISADNIVMGTTIWTAQLQGAGKSLLHGNGNLTLQNITNEPAQTENLKNIIAILNEAGLNAQYSEDIKTAIWRKAAVNCCANATTALLETNINGFLGNEIGVNVAKQIVHEFVAVAKTQDVYLDEEELTTFIVTASLKVGDHYPSMYQDLVRNHRKTEVSFLNGYIAKVGQQHGIPTPYNAFIEQLIHIKENNLQAK